MNSVENILEKHHLWRELIEVIVSNGHSLILNPTVIAQDSLCDLGEWLNLKSSIELLGDERHSKIQSCHSLYHSMLSRLVLNSQSNDTLCFSKENKVDLDRVKLELNKLLLNI